MIYIGHLFHRGKDGRCMVPIRRGTFFAPCGKMVTLHVGEVSIEAFREGCG